MITTLLSTRVIYNPIIPSIAESAAKTLAFDKIENPFIGILAGIIGSACYNRFKDTKLPDWLSFFSGKTLCSNCFRCCFYRCICCSGALVAIGKSLSALMLSVPVSMHS